MSLPPGNSLSLVRLALSDWRNIPSLELEPHPAFNLFTGDNAQGKTNLLEAIYLVSRLKSFRDARFAELVRHGEAEAQIRAGVSRAGVLSRVEVTLASGRRRVRVDGKGIRRVADHCRHYKVVLFTPEDIYLARGSPDRRRRFLDRALYNLEPAFLSDAQEYAGTLQRRNALLKRARAGPVPSLEPSLEAYDAILTRAGARVACRRHALAEALSARIGVAWTRVFGDAAEVALRYRSCVPGVGEADAEDVAASFSAALRESRPADLARGSTSVGPHRDDLEMLLDGLSLKGHASQGQHRVFVLALKVSEIELVVERTGVRPILLLDDVSSELDRQRNERLFDYLDEVRGQVFLTTTTPELVGLSVERAEFAVRSGGAWRSS